MRTGFFRRMCVLLSAWTALVAAVCTSCGLDTMGILPPVADAGDGQVIVCAPTEDCTDGIDNDCNQKVDCADPACMSGFECVQAPDGWTAVAFSEQSRPTCPVGYGSPAPVLEVAGYGAATCTCGVPSLTSAPSCTDGSSTFYGGATNACTTGGSVTFQFTNTQCTSVPNLQLSGYPYVEFTPIAPTSGTCTASLASVNKPTLQPLAGQTCSLIGGAAGGCPAGSLCTAKLTSPFQSCIAKTGSATCTNTFPTQHTVGDALNDTRGCNNCQCQVTATCTNTQVLLYTMNGCSGSADTINADATCYNETSNANIYKGAKYVASRNVNMSASSSPTGDVSVTNPVTLCCR